ncbi:MAG TPA: YdeI/OmpD-associated family protein [Acidobacteriaceae bacterium]|nr:YdeI/OmpD-associated family protein [Acidobacteriaceae bacterium]
MTATKRQSAPQNNSLEQTATEKATTGKAAPQPIRFRAKVESGMVPLDYGKERYWTAVRVPFNPKDVWEKRRGVSVRGTINGLAFRTFLFPSKTHGHLLLVNKTMQKQAGAAPGTMAELVVEPDLEDHTAKPPAELAKLFREDRTVKKWFEGLNYSTRRYICDAVEQRKSPASRERCAEQWVECLMLAMDGEIELPPVLLMAFRRFPGANDGWLTMTPIQRRGQLLAIFQAQSPEARAKRAERTASDAARRSKGISGRKEQSKPEEDAGWMEEEG